MYCINISSKVFWGLADKEMRGEATQRAGRDKFGQGSVRTVVPHPF